MPGQISVDPPWSLDEYNAAWRAVTEAVGPDQRRATYERAVAITALRLPLPAASLKQLNHVSEDARVSQPLAVTIC